MRPDDLIAVLAADTISSHDFSVEALISFRADMLRFARLQLRNAEAAEDMVQEAIEAALRHGSSFSGQSSLKTWVFAILRNRVVNYIRHAGRTVSMSSLMDEGDDWDEQLEKLFSERGLWRDDSMPAPWPDPEASMQNRQFWVVFEACLDHLPHDAARVFMMREFLGLDSEEICAQLGISTGNCRVILHRARLKLRGCMGKSWGPPGT